MSARAAAARTHPAAALLAAFIVFASPSPAAAALPWEWWRDLSQLARLPDGDQVLLRSSHCPSQCRFDRMSPSDPRFLRIENGEAVIFDEPGAGAITRIWMTMGAASGGSTPLDPNVRMRIRIDGESAPRVDLPLPQLFDGSHPPFGWPLTLDLVDSSGGNVSYVPIPYRRGCTVSLVGAESARIWYQIGFHRLVSAAGVTSFRGDEDLSELRRLLALQGGLSPRPPAPSQEVDYSTLLPGQEQVVWQRTGAGEVRRLSFFVQWDYRPLVTLLLDFDGERRVAVPLRDFFAIGGLAGEPTAPPADPREGAASSLLVGIDRDGGLYSYFPMPFRSSARLSLRYDAPPDRPAASVTSAIGWSEAAPAADSARFFAVARAVDTVDPERDVTLLERAGSGKWIGLFLQLASVGMPARDYLEGDERVYVDGATSPAIYGTGVEDFFNGGFFFDRGTVSSALHGSTYQRSTPQDESVDGMYRLLLGDAVPFHGGIRVALENGPGPPTGHLRMRGLAVAYGYSRDGAPWQLVDRLDLTSTRSTRDHRYQPPRGARCATVTGTFENDPPLARTAIGCSFSSGKSSFVLRSPRAGALRLRRLFDAAEGAPEADVFVAGKRVATFPYVAANPYRRWQELDLDLPLPGGSPLQITVRPHAELGGAAIHNEFAYELWQAP